MNNYCDKCGNCSRCGECCTSLIPITRKEEKRIRKYIEENKIKPEFCQNSTSINLKCCFYDIEKRVCKIYKVRPNICKSFKCNRNDKELEQEKMNNHKRAYWNHIENGKESNLTDMRLLFYDDPRSLIANIIYKLTDGTMQCSEEHFIFMKNYLKITGQEGLANAIEVELKK